jgi:phosphoglycolate phosphatase
LSGLGLAIHFSSLVGGDTFSTRKPAGEFILKALSTVGVDRANAVMVGDSANDILAARNAEIPSICVSFGYADPSDLLTGDAVIDNFSELDPSVIERLLAK